MYYYYLMFPGIFSALFGIFEEFYISSPLLLRSDDHISQFIFFKSNFCDIMLVMFDFSSVRASHVLISHNGLVCLSGFRYGWSMIQDSYLQLNVCNYPDNYQSNMNIASPEMLAQVSCQSNMNWVSTEMWSQVSCQSNMNHSVHITLTTYLC